MMTPEQRVQEIELILKNLDFKGFSIQNYLELIDVLEKAETVIGHRLRTLHSVCNSKNG